MNKKIGIITEVLYTIILLTLAAATLIEAEKGSNFVSKNIYGNPWFALLWAFAALGMAYQAIKAHIWQNIPSLAMHIALATILLGSLFTCLTGQNGYAHLIRETTCNTFTDDAKQIHQLPFAMELDSFCVRYYPGTDAPMDYVSYMKVDGERAIVSMNKNYEKDGYSFCQSSFDDNGIGSWLTVNHNPYGVGTTFLGYVLFVIAGLLVLLWPNGTFRRLLSAPVLSKGGLLMVCLLTTLFPEMAKATDSTSAIQNEIKKVPVLPRKDAEKLRRIQVIYQNRIVPFNTVATDFVKKIYGKANYKGLMPEQVVGGWSIAPEIWRDEKMIKIKNDELSDSLGLTGKFCSLADLYDSAGRYRLQPIWTEIQKTPGNSKLEKSIKEIDEKVGIILMLNHNSLFKSMPTDGSVERLSERKVSAEILYNNLPITKILFMLNLTFGLLGIGLLLYKSVKSPTSNHKKWTDYVLAALPFLLGISLLAQAFDYGLRWYIRGNIPLNNGFETMQFLSLCIMLFALLLSRKFKIATSFGLLLSGFTLLVSHLGQMNPQITPLMPVLNSPWLSLHVSMIMMSYALFAFILLNSVLALLLICKRGENDQTAQLTVINKILTYPAVILIGIGILLGSVWANESWGDYWTWDPKEVWALITFMVYSASVVYPDKKLFVNQKYYHIYMILAFLTVLMTYFGVNYILGGMHSYANS